MPPLEPREFETPNELQTRDQWIIVTQESTLRKLSPRQPVELTLKPIVLSVGGPRPKESAGPNMVPTISKSGKTFTPAATGGWGLFSRTSMRIGENIQTKSNDHSQLQRH